MIGAYLAPRVANLTIRQAFQSSGSYPLFGFIQQMRNGVPLRLLK